MVLVNIYEMINKKYYFTVFFSVPSYPDGQVEEGRHEEEPWKYARDIVSLDGSIMNFTHL